MSHFLAMAFLESEVQNLAQSSTSEPCLVFLEWPSDPEEAPAHNRAGVFNWARAEQVYESKHALRQKIGTNMVCCALQCRCGGGMTTVSLAYVAAASAEVTATAVTV